MRRLKPIRYARIDFWVHPKTESPFLARTLLGPVWEVDINHAHKLLRRYLDTRWPAGYEIREKRHAAV
jgi:hypothetical protein